MVFAPVPAVGALFSIWLSSATLKTLNERRRLLDQGLGPLNPYHIIYSVSSNIAWFTYALILRDPYVTTSRFVGLVASVYYILSCLGLMAVHWGKMNYSLADASGLPKELLNEELHRMKTIQYGVVAVVGFWSVVFATLFVICALKDGFILGKIAGWHSNLYFVIRIPHIYAIFRSKSVATIIPQFMIADLLCSASWTFYGFSIKNSNFYVPSGIGVIFATIYVLLFLRYRGNTKAEKGEGELVGFSVAGGFAPLSTKDPDATAALENPDLHLKISVVDIESGETNVVRHRSGTTVSESLNLMSVESPISGAGRHRRVSVMMELPTADDDDDSAPPTSVQAASPSPGIFSQLDGAMEYLVNIGRSRAHSISVRPDGAYVGGRSRPSVPTLQDLSDIYQSMKTPGVPALAADQCKTCGNLVVSDSTFCWSCGTVTETKKGRAYSLRSDGSVGVGVGAAKGYSNSSRKSSQASNASGDLYSDVGNAKVDYDAPSDSGRGSSSSSGSGRGGGSTTNILNPNTAAASSSTMAAAAAGGASSPRRNVPNLTTTSTSPGSSGSGSSSSGSTPLRANEVDVSMPRPSTIEEERDSLIENEMENEEGGGGELEAGAFRAIPEEEEDASGSDKSERGRP